MMPKNSEEFWISNISDMNVSLSDLGISIPARRTVNLLDKKHYSFNKEELLASATKGSLYKKRNKVVVRKIPPTPIIKPLIEIDGAYMPSRQRSIIQLNPVHYEELEISDEKFAEESSDLTDQK